MPALQPEAMQASDHEAIQKLSRSLGRSSEPSRFGDNECHLVLKDPQGQLVGWARAGWWDPSDQLAPAGCYLSGVEISREHQHRGFASILTAARLKWVAERDTAAWCIVNARNTSSLALQASFGFKEIARASHFGAVSFSGGCGLLLRKELSEDALVLSA